MPNTGTADTLYTAPRGPFSINTHPGGPSATGDPYVGTQGWPPARLGVRPDAETSAEFPLPTEVDLHHGLDHGIWLRDVSQSPE